MCFCPYELKQSCALWLLVPQGAWLCVICCIFSCGCKGRSRSGSCRKAALSQSKRCTCWFHRCLGRMAFPTRAVSFPALALQHIGCRRISGNFQFFCSCRSFFLCCKGSQRKHHPRHCRCHHCRQPFLLSTNFTES